MTDRQNWKTGLSIGALGEASLERAAKAGIEAVEFARFEEGADPKNLSAYAKSAGVEIWSVHLPFDWNIPIDPSGWDPQWWKICRDTDADLIKKASETGAKIAVIHASLERIPKYFRRSLLTAAAIHLSALSEICRFNGMTLAVEVLPRTCLGNCADELLAFIQAAPDIRVCFDVNHLLNETHAEFIKKVGKYIVTTHISDYDFEDEKHWMPMQGKIDWKQLLSDLEAADYSGPFLYEIDRDSVEWADVKKNHELLNRL
ncbi:MAG: sugar phosphate isomerase/epimerase [Clostridia bacterium]|nr:sugar phosphate isomerase/epimerase [Clostridia bacterium]